MTARSHSERAEEDEFDDKEETFVTSSYHKKMAELEADELWLKKEEEYDETQHFSTELGSQWIQFLFKSLEVRLVKTYIMIVFLSKASRLVQAILTFIYYVTFSSCTTRSSSGSKLIHNCSPNIKLGVFISTDSHMQL